MVRGISGRQHLALQPIHKLLIDLNDPRLLLYILLQLPHKLLNILQFQIRVPLNPKPLDLPILSFNILSEPTALLSQQVIFLLDCLELLLEVGLGWGGL